MELCKDWDDLKERASARLKRLEDSRALHGFKNNLEDTKTWIEEKQRVVVYNEKLGKDCSTARKLLRIHGELKV